MKDVFYVVRALPIGRERFAKHIPAITNISVAMQSAVDTTIKEDVFSTGPPRDYVSGTEPNQVVVEWVPRALSPVVKRPGR
jgi:hypothetical protein